MRKSSSLSFTLVVTSVIISVVIVFSMGVFSIFNLKAAHQNSNDNYKIAMYNGYRTELAILQALHDQELQGIITTEEAQYQGKEIIRGMRYRDDHSGYFWIDDKDYILVMHPILVYNEGKNRYDLEDQNGVMIVQSILKECLGPEAGGFNSFYFTKADGVTVAPKLAYSGYFEPWGWAISTGNYVDDMDMQIAVAEKSSKDNVSSMIVTIILGTVILLIFAAIIISVVILNLAVKKAKIQLDTPTGDIIGEKPMWVENGEASTVENTGEYFPGLYACGMSANNVMGGYRMGPIFGGMLMSGRKVANLIINKGK